MQATAHGDVLVEFRRLEPGKFVSFTPKSSDFQTIVSASGLDLAALLQDTLMLHTTLSEGDWISVPLPLAQPAAEPGSGAPVGEVSHQWLQVCKLEPDAHVSLVDTDMEADVTPSQEFMERMAEEQEAARREMERVAALEAEEARRQADAAAVRSLFLALSLCGRSRLVQPMCYIRCFWKSACTSGHLVNVLHHTRCLSFDHRVRTAAAGGGSSSQSTPLFLGLDT